MLRDLKESFRKQGHVMNSVFSRVRSNTIIGHLHFSLRDGKINKGLEL